MSNFRFQRGDIVNVKTRGDNRYLVLTREDKGVHSPHLQLQNVNDPKDIFWLYEVHCSATVKQKLENARNRGLSKMNTVSKILNKPKRK